MQIVSIAGVGLIGASFGLGLRKAGFTGKIFGVSSESSIQAGVRIGAIDAGTTLEQAAAISDLIYLSQPIEQILTTLEVLGPMANRECLITDAGSTKSVIVAAARDFVAEAQFLGGHPMAGKERRGATAAEADLFRAKPYVLTPTKESAQILEFRSWLERMGAQVIEMDAKEHDETVALTSHLPQLLSTALASTLAAQEGEHARRVFGPGLIDMTRLALSAPEVWMSVLSTNADAIDQALDAFETKIADLRRRLQDGEVEEFFLEARDFATEIRQRAFTN